MAKANQMGTADKEWQAEEDMRTLVRAEEIKRDPARMKAAKDMAKKKVAELEAVSGEEPDGKMKK